MRAAIEGVSRSSGLARTKILEGTQAYVDLTGDVEGAETAMAAFARITQATGADMTEIATATAAMKESGLAAKDIEAAWSGLAVQGKQGAVGARDLAGTLATLLPMMAQFDGGTGIEGIRDVGAALQVVRKGSGSAAEASTKLQSLVGSIGKNAPQLRKIGIEVFNIDKKTKTRTLKSFRDIIGQIAAKKLDIEQVGDVLGSDKESRQALTMLTQQIGLWDRLKQAALDTGAIQRDYATWQNSTAGKLEKAFNAMKLAIASAFTPERIQRFAEILSVVAEKAETVVAALGKITGFIGDELSAGTVGADTVSHFYGGAKAGKLVEKLKRDQETKKRAELDAFEARTMQSSGGLAQRSLDVGGLAQQLSMGRPDGELSMLVRTQIAAMENASQHLLDAATAIRQSLPVGGFAVKAWDARATTVVKIDGNPIAKASANATNHRNGSGR